MNQVEKNNALFELLKTDISIVSSQIIGLNIHLQNFTLTIDIDFIMSKVIGGHLKLTFTDIKEYSFYHNSDYTFYNVEDYKLLKKGDLFYISFDPDNENASSISKDDNDLILCGDIAGCRY
ncbi:hypothetical protein [Rubrolithibacter danxiaensis]|uniref:hypothetical protein n=1 Tax=Rubrolithibacter danxiaensis TaxID=3390805 RepID=UPI003BF7EF48